MSKMLEFKWRNSHVGTWRFVQAPDKLICARTYEGFEIIIPSKIKIRVFGGNDATAYYPTASKLRLHIKDSNGKHMGEARNHDCFQGRRGDIELDVPLVWRGTTDTLVKYERLRDGGPVVLQFDCFGEMSGLVPSGTKVPRLRSEPERIFGGFQINYPVEVWVEMLDRLKAMRHVLVEFPLHTSPPAPWDTVWKSSAEAQEALKKGGTTGWKGCAAAVRQALDDWRSIEEEDLGPGGRKPTQEELREKTKKQRLENLRWQLRQIAHLGPHSHSDEWSRDEAVLLLATLTGLLAVRDP